MQNNTYPVWRRNLDIYKSWLRGTVPVAEIARNFKVDPKVAREAVDTIGSLLYSHTGWCYSSIEDLEAMFVLVAQYADERDVLRIVRIIRTRFKTLEKVYVYTGKFIDIPGVGPKYAAVLDMLRGGNQIKELRVRISYSAYLKLKEYAEERKRTIGQVLELAIDNL